MSAVPLNPDPEYGLGRDVRPARPMAAVGLPRAWRAADVAARASEVFVDFGEEATDQLRRALPHVRANRFTLATIEKYDVMITGL